jgi:hypothetical protein
VERPHESGAEHGRRIFAEAASVEGQHGLAGTGIETDPVGLGQEPTLFHEKADLGQRVLEVRILPSERGQGLANLPHRRPRVEEGADGLEPQQVAEGVAPVTPQQLEAPKLPCPPGREAQDPVELAESVDPLRAAAHHRLSVGSAGSP